MKSKALRVVMSALLAVTLCPAAAFADAEAEGAAPEEEPAYLVPNDGEGDMAESWRFSDGYPENYLYEEMEEAGIALMGAYSDVESSYRSTWSKSDGVGSYSYRVSPSDKFTKISVPGAQEVGVDISYFNNEKGGQHSAINWKAMKEDGITFAIIRAGDGSTSAKGFYDPWFVQNIQGAKAAGIKVGVYVYSRALNTNASGAHSVGHEVDMVLNQMRDAQLGPADLELPVYFDMEDNTQRQLSAANIAKVAKKFCDTMQSHGYQVGIYANQDWFNNVLTHSTFSPATMKKNGWSRWVARYSWGSSYSGVEATDVWQFTSIGKVSGTPRKYCDVNFSYVEFGKDLKTYHLAYETYGGVLDAPNPVDYTGTLVLPEPERAGYIFEGWYADPSFTQPITKVNKQDTTVYAKWGQGYQVTYKLNGGKNNAANAARFGSSLTLQAPTRNGYQFDGWYLDASFSKKVTKLTKAHTADNKVTVYAKWSQPYKIAYKLNGGKNNKSNPSKFGGTLTLKSPTRSGYTFKGWYTDKKFKTKVTKITKKQVKSGKVTLYAKWVKNYKVTYKLNGGKNNKANPTKYNGTIKLKSPTRKGYVFKGWYTDKKLTKKVTKLKVTKNTTVYAKWQKGAYYKVTADSLNIRKKASSSAKINGTLKRGKKVVIEKVSKGWGKLADGRGWIKMEHTKKV